MDEDFGIRKKQLVAGNKVVTRPIERIDGSIGKKSSAGRKKKFTPTRMRNEINKYFKWCEEEDELPSIKGMMIYLKMYKDMFYKYAGYPEFSNLMEQARLHIQNWCETDVYNTRGLAAGKSLYMKSLHSWHDKVETTNTNVNVMTVDMARAKIDMLAPKLLELLKESRLLDSFATKKEIDVTPDKERG